LQELPNLGMIAQSFLTFFSPQPGQETL